MLDLEHITSISRTKLFRPPVADDYIERARIDSRLPNGQAHPIMVVTAPAGYGKSTLVSHWVEQRGGPCAWVSLDENDNNLRMFLRCLEATLKDLYPPAMQLLTKIINNPELPAPYRIADTVLAEITDTDDATILVFDDYHVIRDNSIHEFVGAFLAHLPKTLQIVIISRRKPPIALSRLRSRDLVLDIQLKDLEFDNDDTRALVEEVTGSAIDAATVAKLQEVTEGWPAGLRMLMLAISGQENVREFVAKVEGNLWQIQEYLVEEALNQLPEKFSNSVYRTGILDRFSADLLDAVLSTEGADDPSGTELLDSIREKNLFCVRLDDRAEWFRYHHLFQEVLLRQCRSRYSQDEIRDLHRRAAVWFDLAGEVEESIRHCLKADDLELAEEIIIRHGRNLNDRHMTNRLESLLRMLPSERLEENFDLLHLLAWNANRLGRITLMMDTIALAEKRFVEIGAGDDDPRYGQLCTLRCMIEAHLGETDTCLASAQRALQILPSTFAFERAEAAMIEALAVMMLGDAAAGREVLYKAIERSSAENPRIRSRLLIGMCYLNWMSGDLKNLAHHSKLLLKLAQSTNQPYAIVHACWYNAAALYQLNELDAAADILQIITAQQWWPHQRSYANCIQIMTLIHAARGESSHALALSEALVEESLEWSSTYYLEEIQATQAALALLRGDYAAATRWALGYEPSALTAGIGFSVPALIAAKILLHDGTDDAMRKADLILQEHEVFYESTFNVRFLSETLALRALHCAKAGDELGADRFLTRAVTLAQPGGFIRLFVDLGPGICPLLNRLDLNEQLLEYVGTILAGFPNEASGQTTNAAAPDIAGLPVPLSKREKEVLELLAKRLTNKEIGEQLFIAPDTVKRHAHNIFEKLNVSSRREARAKAIGFGMVSDQ